jgi:hypothetical protein
VTDLTTVELLWLEKRIENRIRFGRAVAERIIDQRRRVLSFAPGTVFGFVRWASNDFGTVMSRVDILRAATPGQRYSTVPWVSPGGDILLPMLVGDAAHAARASSAVHRPNGLPVDIFSAFITEASKRFVVPEHWIRSVMRVESAGKVRARSRKGAMGLMQIMPETWSDLRARYDLGADPYDPRDNILAGAAYIRELYQRYGTPGFLAAYNSGPARYESHLATGRSLPDETQDYVAILAPMIAGKQVNGKIVAVADSPTSVHSPLFVARSANSSSEDRPSSSVRPERSSNVRPVVDLSALVPQSGNLFVHHASEARSQ